MPDFECYLTLKLREAGQAKGEATAKGFEDQIEIHSFSWGESRSGERVSGQPGQVQMHDFTAMMKTNRASVVIMKACAIGDQVQEAVLKCLRDTANGKQVFLTWTMTDGIVSAYHTSGGGHGGESSHVLPIDTFQIQFRKVAVDYKPQTSDGTLGAPLAAQHDLGKGK